MRGYTGSIAGVEFDDGTAVTEPGAVPNPGRALRAIVGYARRHGLEIVDDRLVVPEPGDVERPDTRDVTETKVGTPLRDAAVDPRPADFLPPINAGQADPHGPDVVAPHVHGAADRRITPGPVHVDNPAAQEISETAAAAEQHDLDAPERPERPAKSANKPEWVAYAISQGADPDEAGAATKDQLVEIYGGDG